MDWFALTKTLTLPQFAGGLGFPDLTDILTSNSVRVFARETYHAWVGPDGAVLFMGHADPEKIWENNWSSWYDIYGTTEGIDRVDLAKAGTLGEWRLRE